MRVISGDHPGYGKAILPTMILLGLGFTFGFSSIMAQATHGVAPHEHGLASGLVQSSGQVGTAFILAVVTALIGAVGASFTDFHPGLNLVAGVALAGLLMNLIPLMARKKAPAGSAGSPAVDLTVA